MANIKVKQSKKGTVKTINKAVVGTEKMKDRLVQAKDKTKETYQEETSDNGTEYAIKASNVKEQHWEALRNLHNQEIFKDSITTATPKYVTVNGENDRLPYQTMEILEEQNQQCSFHYILIIYILDIGL